MARAQVAGLVDLVGLARVVAPAAQVALVAVRVVLVAVPVVVQALVVVQVGSAARLGGRSVVAVATKTSCSRSISSSPIVPLRFLTARSLLSVECRLKSSHRS